MRVRFWGTRGSIATPGPDTVRFGGNTSCVAVTTNAGEYFIFDCGTGARALGGALMAHAPKPITATILLSHTHRDHVGAAAALQAATGAPSYGYMPNAEPGFTPDVPLDGGDTVAGLLAIHTPGHAADHLRKPEVDSGEHGKHGAANQHVMEVRHHEEGVVDLQVHRH